MLTWEEAVPLGTDGSLSGGPWNRQSPPNVARKRPESGRLGQISGHFAGSKEVPGFQRSRSCD